MPTRDGPQCPEHGSYTTQTATHGTWCTVCGRPLDEKADRVVASNGDNLTCEHGRRWRFCPAPHVVP